MFTNSTETTDDVENRREFKATLKDFRADPDVTYRVTTVTTRDNDYADYYVSSDPVTFLVEPS